MIFNYFFKYFYRGVYVAYYIYYMSLIGNAHPAYKHESIISELGEEFYEIFENYEYNAYDFYDFLNGEREDIDIHMITLKNISSAYKYDDGINYILIVFIDTMIYLFDLKKSNIIQGLFIKNDGIMGYVRYLQTMRNNTSAHAVIKVQELKYDYEKIKYSRVKCCMLL